MVGPHGKKDSIRIRLCVPSVYNLKNEPKGCKCFSDMGVIEASERKGREFYGDSGAVKTCLESFLED